MQNLLGDERGKVEGKSKRKMLLRRKKNERKEFFSKDKNFSHRFTLLLTTAQLKDEMAGGGGFECNILDYIRSLFLINL